MKFFVPAATDDAHAETLYQAIRKFNSKSMGAKLSDRRIYGVNGKHNGKAFMARVGQPFEELGETVVAILLDANRSCYLICTANRGVVRGTPYMSGSDEINHSEDFEA
jgi:hypothetical protein